VGGPLLVPLTTHSPTHPPPGLSMSEVIRMAPAKLPSRLDENCRADLRGTKGEDAAEPTLQYFESYQKEWIFGQICIRVQVSVMTYTSNAQRPTKRKRRRETPELRRAICAKAGRISKANHRKRIEATGITFAEHQRKLNRLRVQRWRDKQAKAQSKDRKKAV